MTVSISLKGQLTNISFSCLWQLWRGQSGISFKSNFACLWTKQCNTASRNRDDSSLRGDDESENKKDNERDGNRIPIIIPL